MPRETDVRKETCGEKRDLKKKTCQEKFRDVNKKMPRLREKEISRKRHAERNGCQERDMPRE